jgi:hypothetical protein
MNSNVYLEMLKDIGSNVEIPLYHNAKDNTSINGLKKWYNDNYVNQKFVNKINPNDISSTTDTKTISTASSNSCADSLSYATLNTAYSDSICTASSDVVIPFNYNSTLLSKERLNEIYTNNSTSLNGSSDNKNDYKKQRILFHLENFNIILNTDPSIILNTLKYYMHYYNAVVYNVILQYDLFKLQQLRVTNFKGGIQTVYNSQGKEGHLYTSNNKNVATSGTSDTVINGYTENPNLNDDTSNSKAYLTITNNDITSLGTNLEKIYYSINSSTKYIEMIKKINSNTSDIKDISKDFDEYQIKYNKVVNIYNNDLDTYKTINNHYRTVIVIAIVIIIMAIFIFSIPNIDTNAQMGILLITAVIMIIFYVFYLINLKSSETFINCNYKNAVVVNNYDANIDFSNYKNNLLTYNTFLIVLASGFSSTGDTLIPINDFVDQANSMRRRRILFYKNKIAEYTNASELLKKSADDYYYLMSLIYFSIIIALIAMAFYILFPTMLFTVIIFAILIFLILLIFIIYRINRSTRLFNDKNYWANFNPTSEVIQSL